MAAAILLKVLTAILFISACGTGIGGLVFGYAAFNNLYRQGATDVKPRFITSAICSIFCIICVLGFAGCNKAVNAIPADGADNNETTTTTSITTTVEEDNTSAEAGVEDPEEYEDDAFYVDLSEEDLDTWMKNRGFSLDLLKSSFSDESLPANADQRKEVIAAAMQKYYSPTAKGFDYGAAYPLYYTLEIYDDVEWSSKSEEYRQEAIRKAEDELFKKLFADPPLLYGWVEMFATELDPIIPERNPWLVKFYDEMNAAYAATEAPIGNSAFFEKVKDKNDPKIFLQDYMLNIARVCELLDGYTVPIDKPVQELTSLKNWYMPDSGDANTARIALCEEQENKPSLIFEKTYKSGNVGQRIGANGFDSRPVVYDTTPQKKETPPAETTPVVTTTAPITTTKPKTTADTTPEDNSNLLKIKYLKKDTKEEVAEPYMDWLEEGDEYSVPSPKPPVGYQLEIPSQAVVSGTMPDHNVSITVYYVPKTYDITILYRYRGDNKYVRNPSTGETYNIYLKDVPYNTKYGPYTSPTGSKIDRPGYLPDRYQVSGTATKTVTITVWYTLHEDATVITTTAPPITPDPITTTSTTRKPDGEGGKDPTKRPDRNDNADKGGGTLPTDQGSFQVSEAPRSDNTTTSWSQTTVTSFTNVTDPNGGQVDNGTVPPVTEIVTTSGQIFHDVVTDKDGGTHVSSNTDRNTYDQEVAVPD